MISRLGLAFGAAASLITGASEAPAKPPQQPPPVEHRLTVDEFLKACRLSPGKTSVTHEKLGGIAARVGRDVFDAVHVTPHELSFAQKQEAQKNLHAAQKDVHSRLAAVSKNLKDLREVDLSSEEAMNAALGLFRKSRSELGAVSSALRSLVDSEGQPVPVSLTEDDVRRDDLADLGDSLKRDGYECQMGKLEDAMTPRQPEKGSGGMGFKGTGTLAIPLADLSAPGLSFHQTFIPSRVDDPQSFVGLLDEFSAEYAALAASAKAAISAYAKYVNGLR